MQSTGRAEVGSPPLPRISAYCFISVPEVRVTKEGEGELWLSGRKRGHHGSLVIAYKLEVYNLLASTCM